MNVSTFCIEGLRIAEDTGPIVFVAVFSVVVWTVVQPELVTCASDVVVSKVDRHFAEARLLRFTHGLGKSELAAHDISLEKIWLNAVEENDQNKINRMITLTG